MSKVEGQHKCRNGQGVSFYGEEAQSFGESSCNGEVDLQYRENVRVKVQIVCEQFNDDNNRECAEQAAPNNFSTFQRAY